jgi:hypothetical protein
MNNGERKYIIVRTLTSANKGHTMTWPPYPKNLGRYLHNVGKCIMTEMERLFENLTIPIRSETTKGAVWMIGDTGY